jgi:hypothetical protein
LPPLFITRSDERFDVRGGGKYHHSVSTSENAGVE